MRGKLHIHRDSEAASDFIGKKLSNLEMPVKSSVLYLNCYLQVSK